MKNIVVFTGSGISAESGIKTFRDSGGLWEEYEITEVATPQAFERNPELVLKFYNDRRKQVLQAEPNAAHVALVELEKYYHVKIITQNIDDLHERAGSSNVLHLHGEIMKMRSTKYEYLIYPINNKEIKLGDKCEKGYQLRPHIVWFGEAVPEMNVAIDISSKADIFLVIGTSLEVYPAASLLEYIPSGIQKYFIDPNARSVNHIQNLVLINKTAGIGIPELVEKLSSK